jgi:hypothetical protein
MDSIVTRKTLPCQALESRANLNLVFERQLILDNNVKHGMCSGVWSVVSDVLVMTFDKGDTLVLVKRKPFARDWRGFRIVPVHVTALPA